MPHALLASLVPFLPRRPQAVLGGSCEAAPCPAGQLGSPYAVATLPDGSSFFVADTNNNRIQHLWLNGSVRAVWGKAGAGA